VSGRGDVSLCSSVVVLWCCSKCCTVFQKLLRCGCCKAITDALSRRNYLMSDVGIPEIWHFIYKSRSTSQLTSPDYSGPYTTAEQQTRLFGIYQWVHSRMHSPARTLKILFHVGKYESVLGWVSVPQRHCVFWSPIWLSVHLLSVYPSVHYHLFYVM